jgi:hypothetical protein
VLFVLCTFASPRGLLPFTTWMTVEVVPAFSRTGLSHVPETECDWSIFTIPAVSWLDETGNTNRRLVRGSDVGNTALSSLATVLDVVR